MKISLNGFSDLGKCSFGTLLDDYDTDDNLIYLDHKEVKIEKVEDLFPFLSINVFSGELEGQVTRYPLLGSVTRKSRKNSAAQASPSR